MDRHHFRQAGSNESSIILTVSLGLIHYPYLCTLDGFEKADRHHLKQAGSNESSNKFRFT